LTEGGVSGWSRGRGGLQRVGAWRRRLARARDIAGAMFVHLVVNGAAFFSRTDGELDRGLGD